MQSPHYLVIRGQFFLLSWVSNRFWGDLVNHDSKHVIVHILSV